MNMTNVSFIKIRPEGFYLNKIFLKTIKFKIQYHLPARKKWEVVDGKKILICTSWNGILASFGKKCSQCKVINDCQLKHRIHFNFNKEKCCLEIPCTSYENFQLYMNRLEELKIKPNEVFTLVSTIDRGYWGEVMFHLCKSLP